MKTYMKKTWLENPDLKKNQVDIAEFKRRMKIAWEALPEAVIRKIIKSMMDRCRAVRKARGGYIKY